MAQWVGVCSKPGARTFESTALCTRLARTKWATYRLNSHNISTFEFKHWCPLRFERQEIIRTIQLAEEYGQEPGPNSPHSKRQSGLSFGDKVLGHVPALQQALDHDEHVFKDVRERPQEVFWPVKSLPANDDLKIIRPSRSPMRQATACQSQFAKRGPWSCVCQRRRRGRTSDVSCGVRPDGRCGGSWLGRRSC